MDDLELIQGCIKRERQSWSEFLKRYSRLIYNYIHHILDAKGYAFAEEQVHDIFQEIISLLIRDDFKKMKSYKGRNGCSFASWLRQVVINFSIDYLRRFKPAISIDQEDREGVSLREVLVAAAAGSADEAALREGLASLKECVGILNNREKYFLELHFQRRISLEELKSHFKISRGAIDMQKARIMEKLKRCFKSRGFSLKEGV